MLAKKRHDEIYKIILAEGAVTCSRLVEELGVSLETVRRDLLLLEKEGTLTRVHGGAVATGTMKPFEPLKKRNEQELDKKNELCENAVKTINNGDYIAIGAGSTPTQLAKAIKGKFSCLTVATYSLDVFEILKDDEGVSLILLGGAFVKDEGYFSGSLTVDMINSIHVQKSFIFPSTVSLKHGLGGYGDTFFMQQRALMNVCDQVYILADSSKFEHTALYKLDDMRKEFIYITDSSLPQNLETLYKENGINIITGR